jgi:uncharacterized protein YdcH (DUF465 family)
MYKYINKRINELEKTDVPDKLTLEVLMKQRLHLKKELAKIKHQPSTD